MADVKFQVASFTTPTVVGQTVDIEIAGFGQPKAVMFILNGGGGNDDVVYNTGRAGWGFTDGTVNTALACSDENGNTSTRTTKSVSTQYCVYLNSHLDSNDTPDVGMSFNGWLTDGVQLIHGIGTTPRKMSCILIGGDDVAEVAAHTATIDYDSISGSVDVGFEPSMLFMASGYVSTLNQNNATNQLSMGVCLNDGAETQKSVSVHAQNRNSAASSNNSGLSDTYISVTASNTALANPYNITGFGPTGYSWNAPSGGTGTRYAPSLAIRFTGDPDIALVNTVVPTDGNLAVSGLGFQPSFAMNLSTQNVVARDTLTNVDVFAQSTVIFDETNVRGVSWADEDNVGTSDTGGWTSDSFQSINEPSDGLLYEGPKPTFNADGWTSTLTTLPPTDVLGWALAIGAGGAAPVVEWDGPSIIDQDGVENEFFLFDDDGAGNVASRFSGTGAPFVYAVSAISQPFPQGVQVNGVTGNPFGRPIEDGTFLGLVISAGEDEPAELFTDIATISNATWDDTTLTLNGSNATAQLIGTPVNDTDHHYVFDYDVPDGVICYLRFGGGANQAFITGPASGTFNAVYPATGTDYLMQIATDTGLSTFSNFSVKEYSESAGSANSNAFTMTVAEAAPTPPTDVDGGGPYSGKVGTPIQLSGSYTPGSDPAPTLLWTVFSGGAGTFLPDATSEDPTFTPGDPGDYVLRFSVDPDDGAAIIATADLQATQEFEIVGSSSVDISPAASMSHESHYAISGNTGIEITPAAGMQSGAGYTIAGDSRVTITPLAQMVFGSGSAINGDTRINITPAAGMQFGTFSSISGDVTLNIVPSAAFGFGSEVIGDSSISITPASDMGYSFTRYIDGDSQMIFIPRGMMKHGTIINHTPGSRTFVIPRENRSFIVK